MTKMDFLARVNPIVVALEFGNKRRRDDDEEDDDEDEDEEEEDATSRRTTIVTSNSKFRISAAELMTETLGIIL